MKKTVLVIAYHFPPGGGPGVQRILKHVTYLREANWTPVVLTVENGDFPARDESLLEQVPADVTVIRVPIVEPYTIYRKFMGSKGAAVDVNVNKSAAEMRGLKEKLAHAVRATFFVPDARVAWWRPAAQAALKAVRQHNVNAIYSSSPPYTCSLIARSVKRSTGLPWVAGFRDPWTGFLTTPERWWLPASVDRAMERSVFHEADAVECAWQGIIDDAMEKMPDLRRDKFHHVPNGYDPADFPPNRYVPNNRFTITYTGSLYGRRTPAALLQALDELRKDNKISVADVHLVFVGRFGNEVHSMLSESAFAQSITTIDYVTHTESIAYLQSSEMSLLIVDDAKESAGIVPGKVYEYLGVGRPVIAIAPAQSAVEQLITETQAGFSVPGTDVAALSSRLLTAITRWKNAEPIATPNVDVIRQYERRTSAFKLASILDQLTTT
ncbi:MAG: glycosyltransferase family 4 protein [Bradyrhizobiaceae bacterium]|nr:glycosyltransferase family 4 protein [Bradyrhizobiaceae bacterium]